MYKVMLIDDEDNLHAAIEKLLVQNGYAFCGAEDAERGLALLAGEKPDLLLLDVMLPGMNGFDLCRRIREEGRRIPIIFLSAKCDIVDKSIGFKAGGDDYVVKPFSPKELMARVNAVLARKKAAAQPQSQVMKFDGLEINIAARTVTVDGHKVDLTPKEYDLLFYLVENKNIALSRDKLLSDIWGYDFFGDDRTIDTHIKNLRNNLGPYRDFIVTLRGVGYKFEYEN